MITALDRSETQLNTRQGVLDVQERQGLVSMRDAGMQHESRMAQQMRDSSLQQQQLQTALTRRPANENSMRLQATQRADSMNRLQATPDGIHATQQDQETRIARMAQQFP